MRERRKELVAHVGGQPSATQRVMIERAVQLTLQIALLDAKAAEVDAETRRPAGMTEHDSRTYLAWTNSLTRLMRQLGMQGAADRPATLKDHLASRATAA